ICLSLCRRDDRVRSTAQGHALDGFLRARGVVAALHPGRARPSATATQGPCGHLATRAVGRMSSTTEPASGWHLSGLRVDWAAWCSGPWRSVVQYCHSPWPTTCPLAVYAHQDSTLALEQAQHYRTRRHALVSRSRVKRRGERRVW